jgi:hypothetical protein
MTGESDRYYVDRCLDGLRDEEKIIVQHRLTGATPSCVVYAPYGQAYRLE